MTLQDVIDCEKRDSFLEGREETLAEILIVYRDMNFSKKHIVNPLCQKHHLTPEDAEALLKKYW